MFTQQELDLLNSKIGWYHLLKRKKTNPKRALEEIHYQNALSKQQEELIKLQNWVIHNDKKVVILFEGRDAAGKGGAIRRITKYMNPRHFRVVALNIPTEDQQKQWYFQRYSNQLPKPGKIVFFDRSWYNRAVVEPVNGFCSQNEYNVFMSQVNDFERMIVQSDIYLIKLYFSISKEEQFKRFREIEASPLKRWKMTPVDQKAQSLWDEYTTYKIKMFEKTNLEQTPWKVIDANKKSTARLEAISHILNGVPYE